MTINVHGAHEGRLDRIKQTQDWLGAKVVEGPFSITPDYLATDPNPDMQLAHDSVEAIRASLEAVQRVYCGEPHIPTAQTIFDLLTVEERAHVEFSVAINESGPAKEKPRMRRRLREPVR